MPTSSDVDFSVSGLLDPVAVAEIRKAAEAAEMTVDEYVLGSALHAAAFSSVVRGYEQAKRGEFYAGTMEDIKREARARFESQQS